LKKFITNIWNKIIDKVLQPNENFITHILVAIILIPLLVLTGGSALYTSDSGAYLLNARELNVPGDRTIFYSAFIHYASKFLEFFHQPHIIEILLIQSLIAYLIIYSFIEKFFLNKNRWYVFLGFLLFCVATPLPWLFIQLMPDLFTSIAFFTALLFLRSKDITESILFALILVFCLVMHTSNVLLFFVFSGGIFILRKKITVFEFIEQRFLQLFLVSVLAIFCVVATNVYAHKKFTLGTASHIFLMGKLSENGVLKKYLDKYCGKEINALCAYKEKLPEHGWDFVWESDGVFAHSGGWNHSDTLYNKIIAKTITDPELLSANIVAAIKATAQQFVLTGAGDGMGKIDTTGTLATELKQYYPHDYRRLITESKQQKEEIDFAAFNKGYVIMQWFFVFIALIVIIKQQNKLYEVMFLMALFYAICNAFVTGALVNVLVRLNTKGIIVLVAIGIFIVLDSLRYELEKRVKKNEHTL
jgi:hypothetical protein